MIKKFTQASIFLLFGYLNGQAQGQYDAPLGQPKEFNRPLTSILSYANDSVLYKSAKTWIVVSDRPDARTSKGEYLALNQKYYVLAEERDRLLLTTYDKSKVDEISNSFKKSIPEDDQTGWVLKADLLLWTQALRSESNGFRTKVMTVNTPETILDQNVSEANALLEFFDSPYATRTNGRKITLFDIFYMLKEENERILLSRIPDVREGEISDYVLGWVDKKVVKIWNQRQALEPNWDASAVTERDSIGLMVAAFSTPEDAVSFKNGRIANSTAIWSDLYERREVANWKRWPILELDTINKIARTAIISDLLDEEGKGIELTAQQYATWEKLYNDQRERARSVNIVFVVDGTGSMGPYMPEVRKAIMESMRDLDTKNRFRFGLVVYRDFEENLENQFEVWPITESEDLMTTLETVSHFADKDSTFREAVYTGMLKGFESLSERDTAETETNILIVLGDAGSHENEQEKENLEELKEKMEQYMTSLVVIQSHHGESAAYRDFNAQSQRLIFDHTRKVSNKLINEYRGIEEFDSYASAEPRWGRKNEGYNTYEVKGSQVVGVLKFANYEESIHPTQVKEEIVAIINNIDSRNNRLLAAAQKIMDGRDPDDPQTYTSFDKTVFQFLLNAGFSKDMVEKLVTEKYRFMLQSYVPLEREGVNNDLIKYVVFLDQKELDEVAKDLSDMVDLDEYGSYFQKRRQLIALWKRVLESNYGVDPNDIEGRSLGELVALVTGLPCSTPLLDMELEDIEDELIVSDLRLDEIINYIKGKSTNLSTINSDPASFFNSNDEQFYWVPSEFFP